MRCYFTHFLITILLIGTTLGSEQDFDDDVVVSDEVDTIHEEQIEDESINYQSPYAEPGSFYFAEHFDEHDKFQSKWIKSEAKKNDASEEIAKYDGVWIVEQPQRPILRGDLGLVLKSKAKHAAISSRLNKPFVFSDKPLIVQYEVTLQEGQECGGAYIKLLSTGKETTDLKNFQDKTPYTIMFGPDKCGNDVKLHFIFRHVNPINGSITEKHCKKPRERLQEPFTDKQPHLYQLVLHPDNTFNVKVDHKIVNEGSLLHDFTPAVNPSREIDDPKDSKPSDWDEREKIPDPDAKKPDDWDEDAPPQIPDSNAAKPEGWLDNEEEMIPDPNAEKPDDWDTDMDGDWEAPLIPNPMCEKAVGCGLWKPPLISNPNYKGKWRAPLLDNPNYQGKWAPKKIINPDFFEDLHPFRMTSISAVGIELWSMSSDILFDNFVITDNEDFANQWASQTYDLKKKQIDKDADTLWDKILKQTNYKPGYWAMYFIYCLIPIVIYVWYLKRRANENKETFVSRVINFTNENPWIWAVYVVVIGLPLALLIFYLCSPGKEKVAENKKTDEPTLDDFDPSESPEHTDNGDSSKQKSESPRRKKSDLDEPAVYQQMDDESSHNDEVHDDEEDETENIEEIQSETKETEINKPEVVANEATRKRRPRKE